MPASADQRGAPLGQLHRIWRLLDYRRRRQLALLQGISLLMGLATLGGIAAVFPFFAVLADPDRIVQMPWIDWLQARAGFSDPRDFLALLGFGFVAMVLIANAINLLGFLAIDRFAQNLAADLHVALFDEYLHRDFVFHARTGAATLLSRVIYDCRRLAVGIVHSALTFFTSVVTCLCIALSALLVTPGLAFMAALFLGGGYGLAYALVRRRLARNGRAQTHAVIEQTRIAGEGFGAIKEILQLGAQGFFREAFRERCRTIANNVTSTAAIAHTPRHLAEALGAAGLVGIGIWMTRDASRGAWIAQLSVLALAMYRLLPALQLAFASIVRLRADSNAFEQVEADLGSALVRTSVAPQANATSRRSPGTVELVDVRFRYAPDLPWVLRGVNMRIPAGATVGLVGANASGKSTLADLILGLLVPNSGDVVIDGAVLSDENRAAWRATGAYVPQQPLLLDAALRANVAFGVAAPDVDPERLGMALRLAGLEPAIAEGLLGMDTPIGERGARLSGGQRQKIALARAFYRRASLLVLDEATSALDGISEQDIVDVLRGLRGTCTTLVIAHRMNSVRECDVIFEIEDGVISGVGTCAELLRTSAGFRRMAGVRS